MSYLDTLARALLGTSSDAIIAADKDGVVRFWNPGAERIFGYTSEDAVGQSLDIIIPERLRKRHWDCLLYTSQGRRRKARVAGTDRSAAPENGSCWDRCV